MYFQLANAFELYDMHGHITEWCDSMYWPYKGGPQQIGNRDGYWLEYKNYRVVRGGAWIAACPRLPFSEPWTCCYRTRLGHVRVEGSLFKAITEYFCELIPKPYFEFPIKN
ncbi:SUMF1/EgtB/PvdO family nonheme iron enzyme [Trichormus azollae]|uniref:SUMF1/EgtB/PvdO family nonheme iron enzyme n=1 Tax=Trichormus azollae TaxID=1164 RepID=UPI00325CC0C0